MQLVSIVPVAHRYQVWLVGHSIVYWAGRYAKKSGWGQHLGLDTSLDIHWLARRGMLWPSLLLWLRNSVLQYGFLDAIVLQLGENDIPASKGVALQNSMRDDLKLLRCKMPKTKLFWSCLLERRTWRNAVAPARVNKVRSKVCRSAARLVLSMGGDVIPHVDLSHALPALFFLPAGRESTLIGLGPGHLVATHVRHALLEWSFAAALSRAEIRSALLRK
uniref:Uncharacterized protein n=1 Tax=Sphaerodactylus townsendi TaxID=933632 RepID=A0ACB8F3J5_9SAUR